MNEDSKNSETDFIKQLRTAAEQGDAQAQCRLGNCYEKGWGVPKDEAEAAKWLSRAAEQGVVRVEDLMNGKSPEKVKTVCSFVESVEDLLGDGGVPKDEEKDAKWYRKSAEQCDAKAQFNLGACHEHGWGVPQDYAVAAKWYCKAAEQGVVQAQYNLGNFYYKGTGVPQDYAEAVKWFRKAAEQGFAEAQYNLGICYLKGVGVHQDQDEAVKWFCKVAEQGDEDARNILNDLNQKSGNKSGYSMNIQGLKAVAEQGDAEAQYHLGGHYFIGEGVPQDHAEAVKWFRKAAEQGFDEAQFNLGVCYLTGDGVPKNKEEAAKWFCKAAEQGHARAQFNLAGYYSFDAGDEAEAAKWFRKAGEQGHVRAQYNLGIRYLNGDGVPEDHAEAAKWLRKAAEQGDEEARDVLNQLSGNTSESSMSVGTNTKALKTKAQQGLAETPPNQGNRKGGWLWQKIKQVVTGAHRRNGQMFTPDRVYPGAKRTLQVRGVDYTFCWCPAGEFMMGSPESEAERNDNEILHLVRLTRGFWILETPVTQRMWKSVMKTTIHKQRGLAELCTYFGRAADSASARIASRMQNPYCGVGPDYPMYYVSWKECLAYCLKLSKLIGVKVALPTEAQWEYACRAGSTTALYGGEIEILGQNNVPALDPIAWYSGNSNVGYSGGELKEGYKSSNWPEMQYPGSPSGTHEVKQKKPNAWGLYDMLGNVWEWCSDWYDEDYYKKSPSSDPEGPSDGSSRVIRGGSWLNSVRVCRSAGRHSYEPDDRGCICRIIGQKDFHLGFRPVIIPDEE